LDVKVFKAGTCSIFCNSIVAFETAASAFAATQALITKVKRMQLTELQKLITNPI
jgi:hypothetical protein